MPVIPPKIASQIIPDALLALLDAVKAIDSSGAETLATFDRVADRAAERRTSFFEEASKLGETLTPEVVSIVLVGSSIGSTTEALSSFRHCANT